MRSISSRATLALLTLAFAAGCGLESSVVGGRCRDGMVRAGSSCVAAPQGITLITPTEPPPNASFSDGGPDAGDPLTGDALTIDPSEVVPGLPEAGLTCAPPLILCHGACISVTSDPMNCGACGKICPSNICVAGECQGATPGDVVLIGHDYANANPASSQSKVLINALTIPTTDPIRILSFEDGASAQAVAMTKVIAKYAITNRSVQFTVALSASSLADVALGKSYDIVIVHDASAVDAVATGASWAGSLGSFAAKGGVVVAIDRGTSPMPQLLSSAGLLPVASHTVLPEGLHLFVSAAADVIGAQVVSPYAGFGAPVSFQGLPAPSQDLSWVVRPQASDGSLGDPVVVHRTVR